MAIRYRRLSLRQGLLFILCIPAICIFWLGKRQQPIQTRLDGLTWSGPKCLGWKATEGCFALGPRQPGDDKTCDQEVNGQSGYCLCEGNMTVARMSCGPHRFRCDEKCAELVYDASAAQMLPKPLACGPHDGYDIARLLPTWAAWSSGARDGRLAGLWGVRGVEEPVLSNTSTRVWNIVDERLGQHDVGGAKIPGPRLDSVDWVMEGRRMKAEEVEKLALAVAGLLRDLPPYPTTTFSGRGVVMVGGGLHYLIPAWTNLHVLRRAGCLLPVELWFPNDEFPTPSLEAALSELGVLARRLSGHGLAQSGYGVKVEALLLSSFQEVLFLDSDNAVLRDPTFLFESEPYILTGALLWPDYWDRTAAPEISRIFGIPRTRLPTGTFESGQMVIDKARHWRGLLVAAYMNLHGETFSELLSCYIGKGDKETFAYGILAAGEALWVSPYKPGSAGIMKQICSPPGRAAICRKQFLGNTMVQYGPDGVALFFHANYHKWDLAIPDSFEKGWNRRWQVLQPARKSIVDIIYSNNITGAGYDVERFIYDVLRAFRCAAWFDSYHAARVKAGESALTALDGFHPLPNYITFRDLFRYGWTGNFDNLAYPPLALWDRLVSWYHGHPRWWIQPWARRFCRWRRKLLPAIFQCRK